MKNGFWIGAKLLIAAAIFWLISRFVDLEEASRMILSANADYLLVVLLLIAPFALLESTRWISLMRALGRRFPFKTSLIYTLVGWFFNNISPANTGQDVFRAVQMARAGIDKNLAVKSVIMFRIASFWSLLLLVIFSFPFALQYAESPANRYVLAAIVACSLLLLGVFLFLDLAARILPQVISRKLPASLMSPIGNLRLILLHSRHSLPVGFLGIAVHLWRVLIIYVLAVSLGIQTSYAELALFVPIALLVAMLPITIGDWGTREAAFAFFLPWISMSAEQAVGLSVLFGLYRICLGLPGAFVWLALGKDSYTVSKHR